MSELLSKKGLFHLFIVYTLWSTTYLAMRIGVDATNGFPPFVFGSMRMLAAGVILLIIARLQKHPLLPLRQPQAADRKASGYHGYAPYNNSDSANSPYPA